MAKKKSKHAIFDVPNLDDLTTSWEEMVNLSLVLKHLGDYAKHKAMAMRLRIEGKPAAALWEEEICEKLYNGMPEWAKW